MGVCTSKQEGRSVKETSSDQRRGRRRRPIIKEKVIFDQLKEVEREWRKERNKLREEVKRLRKIMKEREVANTTIEEREYWKCVVEELCVERVVRDEAIEKWKQLYLAIKNELDHLIIHTTSSSREETMQRKLEKQETKTMEELRDEVRVKEETIEILKKRIILKDREEYEKEREIDLLRQSLKILGSKKKKKITSFESINMLLSKTKC
ncbi:unnamed protein product [Cochlearia groenlandica]